MVTDLVESSLDGQALDTLLFGGAPAPDQLPKKAKEAFPNTVLFVSSLRFCLHFC